MTAEKKRPESSQELDLNHRRVQKAAATRRQMGDETRVKKLLEHGWTVISPYDGSVRGPRKVKLEDADS